LPAQDPASPDGRSLIDRLPRPIQKFLDTESSGGVALLIASAAALAWANLSPSSYFRIWEVATNVSIGPWELPHDLRSWVNDGLMALFFFVVGLEIKRELAGGELADKRKAALPVVAAVGGMALPALIYLSINAGGGAAAKGWGVPMATDIAFSVGVLALLGTRVPPALKVFLVSLAIADDIGAIAIIAFIYSRGVELVPLGVAACLVAGIVVVRRLGGERIYVFAVLGLGVWLAVLESGIHPTIAGVALGLLAPTAMAGASSNPWVAERLESVLHPWTSFVIIPIFALANAGLRIDATTLSQAINSRTALGIVLGLVAGKTLGVIGFTWLATRHPAITLPTGVSWLQLSGVAAIAGIGFTVALFISTLAFDQQALQDQAKVGIMAGSLFSAVIGVSILWFAGRRKCYASGRISRPGADG
jgi:Na+:H+ antiporter, NhaA family